MVRTLDSGTRASGAKASRKGFTASNSSSSTSNSSSFGSGVGGNPVCPRETPGWQKPITTFFVKKPNSTDDNECSTSSTTENCPSEENHTEADDDEIKHVNKKIRISSQDSDEEDKENKDETNNDEDKIKKTRYKLKQLVDSDSE